jgi:hypothetical protein
VSRRAGQAGHAGRALDPRTAPQRVADPSSRPSPPPNRNLTTSIVNAQDANGKIVWGVKVGKTAAADTYSQVTGTFTLRSPRGGALTDAAVAGDNGACTVTCPGTATANVDVVCSFTCPGSTSVVTPSVKVGFWERSKQTRQRHLP